MPDAEKLLKVDKITISAMFDTIKIELICKDDYEATVLFDDLTQRVSAGETICLDTSTKVHSR